MSERKTYYFRARLDQLTAQFKRTVERAEQIPSDRRAHFSVAEERMRDSVATAARARISVVLKQLRVAHNLTYEDIQAHTGLSQQLLWDVEYNERRLTLNELEKIANCYQLRVGDILGVDVE